MQLLLAEPEDVPDLIISLRKLEQHCREHAARIMVAWEEAERSPQARISSFASSFVKDGLMSRNQATMEWAERTRHALEQLGDRDDHATPGRRRP